MQVFYGLGLHYWTIETTNYVHILRGKNQLLELQEKQELKLVCKCVSEDQRGLI